LRFQALTRADRTERGVGDLAPDEGMDYERTLAQIERSILGQALQKTAATKRPRRRCCV